MKYHDLFLDLKKQLKEADEALIKDLEAKPHISSYIRGQLDAIRTVKDSIEKLEEKWE